MLSLKTLITEVKYDYGCFMAQLPPNIATLIVNFGKQIIPDDQLYFDNTEPDDYGREKEPHITIKFGLTQSYTQSQLQQLLVGTKPFSINIRGLSVFQNPNFDVIKFDVDGQELTRLRTIFDKLPNNDEYKEYHPHMTLAYVKPGVGQKFQNKKINTFSKTVIDLLKYSDRGTPIYFKL